MRWLHYMNIMKYHYFIVENGLGAVDILKKDHTCDDDYRIAYLKEYITEMKKAVEIDGVDLMGYTHGAVSIWYRPRRGR